jgi:hypothetical protein
MLDWFQRLMPQTLVFFSLFERHAATVTEAAEHHRRCLDRDHAGGGIYCCVVLCFYIVVRLTEALRILSELGSIPGSRRCCRVVSIERRRQRAVVPHIWNGNGHGRALNLHVERPS